MTQRTTLAAHWRSILLAVFAISFFACSSDGGSDNGDVTSNSLLLNFTSDYTTGELRWMDMDSENLSAGGITFHQDSKVIAHNGLIFVLEKPNNGAEGILNCLSPSTINDPATIVAHKLKGGNPYDIAFAGNTGYIAMQGSDELETFNLATCELGETIPFPGYANGEISLSANAASIKASGDTLLIVLQRLENWEATKPGLLVRMKTNGSIIDTIQLKFYNPNSSILNNGKLIVASNNYFSDDGIEIVNLASGTSEILVDRTALGAGASSIALDENTQTLYASVYLSWNEDDTPIKPINLNSGLVGSALPSITEAGNLVFDNVGEKLYAGDRGSNPGLKIYNPATNLTITAGNQDPSLPPYSISIVRW